MTTKTTQRLQREIWSPTSKTTGNLSPENKAYFYPRIRISWDYCYYFWVQDVIEMMLRVKKWLQGSKCELFPPLENKSNSKSIFDTLHTSGCSRAEIDWGISFCLHVNCGWSPTSIKFEKIYISEIYSPFLLPEDFGRMWLLEMSQWG